MALARTQKRAHARDLFLQHQQQQEPEGDAGWFAAGHRPKAARMEFVTHHRQQAHASEPPAHQRQNGASAPDGAEPTITSVSVELMERLRRQKVAKEQAAAAEQRRTEAHAAAEAAEAEWRRLQDDAEKLEQEGAPHGDHAPPPPPPETSAVAAPVDATTDATNDPVLEGWARSSDPGQQQWAAWYRANPQEWADYKQQHGAQGQRTHQQDTQMSSQPQRQSAPLLQHAAGAHAAPGMQGYDLSNAAQQTAGFSHSGHGQQHSNGAVQTRESLWSFQPQQGGMQGGNMQTHELGGQDAALHNHNTAYGGAHAPHAAAVHAHAQPGGHAFGHQPPPAAGNDRGFFGSHAGASASASAEINALMTAGPTVTTGSPELHLRSVHPGPANGGHARLSDGSSGRSSTHRGGAQPRAPPFVDHGSPDADPFQPPQDATVPSWLLPPAPPAQQQQQQHQQQQRAPEPRGLPSDFGGTHGVAGRLRAGGDPGPPPPQGMRGHGYTGGPAPQAGSSPLRFAEQRGMGQAVGQAVGPGVPGQHPLQGMQQGVPRAPMMGNRPPLRGGAAGAPRHAPMPALHATGPPQPAAGRLARGGALNGGAADSADSSDLWLSHRPPSAGATSRAPPGLDGPSPPVRPAPPPGAMQGGGRQHSTGRPALFGGAPAGMNEMGVQTLQRVPPQYGGGLPPHGAGHPGGHGAPMRAPQGAMMGGARNAPLFDPRYASGNAHHGPGPFPPLHAAGQQRPGPAPVQRAMPPLSATAPPPPRAAGDLLARPPMGHPHSDGDVGRLMRPGMAPDLPPPGRAFGVADGGGYGGALPRGW